MQIEPIRHSVTVSVPKAEALELFTTDMQGWWPTQAAGQAVRIDVGQVLERQSPRRVLLGWQLDAKFEYDESLVTEVEINFTALDDGATRIALEHRKLELFATRAAEIRGTLSGGWPHVLERFQARVLADQSSEAEHG